MNPNELIEKMDKQNQALKQKFGPEVSVTDDLQEFEAKIQKGVNSSKPSLEEEVDIIPQRLQDKGMRDRIEALERELGETPSASSERAPGHKVFLDEYGEETFYVQNMSNGHVLISDIDLNKIARGKALDLLKLTDLESLKKSRDLRVALSGYGGKKLLKRLTPEEYIIKKQQELEDKRTIDMMRKDAASSPQGLKTSGKIRPTVLSKLEKLSLGQKAETSHQGMTSIEFLEWAQTEDLSGDELDFIIGSVLDSHIRHTLSKRKAELSLA